MKKTKLWAKFKIREELNRWWGVEGDIDLDGIYDVMEIIDQIDEPEGLSKELPVIPQFVADYLEKAKKEIDLLRVFEIANGLDELEIWRKEYNWIRLYHLDFARAWLDGYEVEKEQKYYVDLDSAAYVAKWNGDGQVNIYTDGVSGSDQHELHLTEQEIKNFDERFWPFAKPVE